jgi:uncharacterized protein (DUF58 family)
MRRLFLIACASDRWFRWRFTAVGRTLLGSLIAVGLFALNPRASSAYQLAVVIVAVLVCALLWAPWFRPRVSVHRRLPGYATEGQPFRYQVVVHNRGRRALRGVSLREDVPLAPLHRGLSSGGGYRGYLRAMRRAQGFRGDAVMLPDLAAGEQTTVMLRFTPRRRGYVSLPALLLQRADPLGVFRAWRRLRLRDRVLCLPRRYRVAALSRQGRSRHARSGVSTARASGDGLDFARLREYRPGDALRHMDWRAWARLGEPVVKEFHEESPARSALLLDTALPPGGDDSLFEAAVSVAASFAVDRNWRGEQLDLLFAGTALLRVAQGREREGVTRMLECLACVQSQPAGRFAETGAMVRRMLGQFSSCVCVLTRLDPERERVLGAMVAGGAEVWALCLHPGAAPARATVTASGARVLHLPVDELGAALAELPRLGAGQRGHG